MLTPATLTPCTPLIDVVWNGSPVEIHCTTPETLITHSREIAREIIPCFCTIVLMEMLHERRDIDELHNWDSWSRYRLDAMSWKNTPTHQHGSERVESINRDHNGMCEGLGIGATPLVQPKTSISLDHVFWLLTWDASEQSIRVVHLLPE